ncbi:hypothetical protein ACTFIU_002441 [Dictyostelium citrinum]
MNVENQDPNLMVIPNNNLSSIDGNNLSPTIEDEYSKGSFIKNLVNTGTNLLFSSSSSISSPPNLNGLSDDTNNNNTSNSNNNNNNNGTDSAKPLSFENDMSDGYDSLVRRSEIAIDQCKELLEFFKKRASEEEKYSKNITNMFSKFKVKDDHDTFQKGVSLLNKINDAEATIHRSFSQNITTNLYHPLNEAIKDMEKTRKRLVEEGKKLKNDIKDSIENVKKSNQKYEKLCREMELAKLELIEEGNDTKSGKVETLEKKLEKTKLASIKAEDEYKEQIKETNEFISGVYQTRLSENLREFQQFELTRLEIMKSNIRNYIGFMKDIPLALQCEIDGSKGFVDIIDPEVDLQHYIMNNSNPKKVLLPFIFEAYNDHKPFVDQHNQNSSSSSSNNALNYASPMSASGSITNTITSQSGATIINNGASQPIEIPTPQSISELPPTQQQQVQVSAPTSVNQSSSPPINPIGKQQSLKENIFGFFNKATTNLKSSTSSLLTKDVSSTITTSSNNTNQLSKSSGIGLPILNSNSIFGVELEVLIENDNSKNKGNGIELEVPLILTQFVQSLLKLESFKMDGIFVSLPPHFNIQQEKQKLDQTGSLENITDVYLIASLFKNWIGDLPNPLIKIIESPDNAWKIIETGIPILHRRVLHYIIDFLVDFVNCSNIDTHSISLIFTPVLIRSPFNGDTLLNSKKEVAVIENMIIDSLEKKRGSYILKRKLPIIPDNENSDDDDDSGHIDDENNSSTSGENDINNINNNNDDNNNNNNNKNNNNNNNNSNSTTNNNSNNNNNANNNDSNISNSNENNNNNNNNNNNKNNNNINNNDDNESNNSGCGVSSNGNNINSSVGGSVTHHFLYQTTPTNNVTPVLSDFFDTNSSNGSTKTNTNTHNLGVRNSSNISFDTISTNQSDSEPVLVEYDNDDFDILSYK